jgi:hypothetical protein
MHVAANVMTGKPINFPTTHVQQTKQGAMSTLQGTRHGCCPNLGAVAKFMMVYTHNVVKHA